MQAEANSPEQFVGLILKEKISGSFINEVYGIYSGEVEGICFQELEFLSMCVMLTIMDFWLILMALSHSQAFSKLHILNSGELHTILLVIT